MAAPKDERVCVPIDDPEADTEWNDILRKQGIIPEKPPSPTAQIEEIIIEGRRLAHENRLRGKDLDELDELEDLEDVEFLEKYRQQRIQEIAKLEKSSIHGIVYPITKPDYAREVTEASNNTTVLVFLKSANVESRKLSELWELVAHEYKEIKFCEIRGEMAIENYPMRNCPTILAYQNGDIVKQVVTLAQYGGIHVKLKNIEDILLEIGAVKDDDMRITAKRRDDAPSDDREDCGLSKSIRGTNRVIFQYKEDHNDDY